MVPPVHPNRANPPHIWPSHTATFSGEEGTRSSVDDKLEWGKLLVGFDVAMGLAFIASTNGIAKTTWGRITLCLIPFAVVFLVSAILLRRKHHKLSTFCTILGAVLTGLSLCSAFLSSLPSHLKWIFLPCGLVSLALFAWANFRKMRIREIDIKQTIWASLQDDPLVPTHHRPQEFYWLSPDRARVLGNGGWHYGYRPQPLSREGYRMADEDSWEIAMNDLFIKRSKGDINRWNYENTTRASFEASSSSSRTRMESIAQEEPTPMSYSRAGHYSNSIIRNPRVGNNVSTYQAIYPEGIAGRGVEGAPASSHAMNTREPYHQSYQECLNGASWGRSSTYKLSSHAINTQELYHQLNPEEPNHQLYPEGPACQGVWKKGAPASSHAVNTQEPYHQSYPEEPYHQLYPEGPAGRGVGEEGVPTSSHAINSQEPYYQSYLESLIGGVVGGGGAPTSSHAINTQESYHQSYQEGPREDMLLRRTMMETMVRIK